MPYPPLPSIDIATIDMQKCYLNAGCALSIHNPDTVQTLLGLLHAHFGPVKLHTTCCRHEPNLPAGSTIINCCAGATGASVHSTRASKPSPCGRCWRASKACRCRATRG